MNSAFRACYSDWKLVKTRGVIQVVMEIPLQDADAAYEVLGGMPAPATERWFGIAALKDSEPAKLQPSEDKRSAGAKRDKRDWSDLQPQQQAGIRCNEPTFIAFLKEERPDDWHEAQNAAECVRLICGVESRVELGINPNAGIAWSRLESQYQAWRAVEHA
ncbi:hypothetical protein ACWAT4_21725 [Bradyrhizobium manausense]